MGDYLEMFRLEREPFTQPERGALVLATPALADAHARIRRGLEADRSRICVQAGAGMGKTSLARALPRLLAGTARVSVVSGRRPWSDSTRRIARHLEVSALEPGPLATARKGGRLVMVIDDADRLDEAALATLDRWLSWHDGGGAPLLQCVLLADLDGATRRDDDTPLLWWLDTLHTLQLELAPLPASAVPGYIGKHLRKAGFRGDGATLFDPAAAHRIHQHCGGNPRRIGELCRMLLTVAGEYGMERVDLELVELALQRRPAPSLSEDAVARAEATARERSRRRGLMAATLVLAVVLSGSLVVATWPRATEPAEPAVAESPSTGAAPPVPVRIGEPRRTPVVRHVRSADGSLRDELIVPPGHPAHRAGEGS